MEIKLRIEDIDYEAAAETFAPLIIEYLKKEANQPLVQKMLSGPPAMAKNAAKTILSHLPQEKKDALLVRLLNENRNAICKALESYAAEKHLYFHITGASASST